LEFKTWDPANNLLLEDADGGVMATCPMEPSSLPCDADLWRVLGEDKGVDVAAMCPMEPMVD
jgi:hypothetical protein